MHEELTPYLVPSPGVDSGDPRIVALARNLSKGASTDKETAVCLFRHVRDSYRYSPYSPFGELSDYLGTKLIDRGYGFCIQKSALLVALARAADIPARFCFADLKNHNLPGRMAYVLGSDRMIYHTYVEFFLGQRWLKATPSFEKSLSNKMGWRLVEFDGVHNAVLPKTDLYGKPHIEYILDRGNSDHIPLEKILEAWEREYGSGALKRWEEAASAHPGVG